MTGTGHVCTTLPLGPVDGPCEAVVLTSRPVFGGTFEASAVRAWITDLDGTGLEADGTDPVTVLAGPAPAGLDAFHAVALAELHRRRSFDFEIADLFVPGLP
jgi:hypothetical protein